jgi:hypothetical protein
MASENNEDVSENNEDEDDVRERACFDKCI